MAKIIPSFIYSGNESIQSLQMRLTSQGLCQSEIRDILQAIDYESKVHVRRAGKDRLYSPG